MSDYWKAVRALGFWRTLWLTWGYRPFSRLLHRLNLHYAPPHPALANEAGWPMHWCQWCGLRDHVMEQHYVEPSASESNDLARATAETEAAHG